MYEKVIVIAVLLLLSSLLGWFPIVSGQFPEKSVRHIGCDGIFPLPMQLLRLQALWQHICIQHHAVIYLQSKWGAHPEVIKCQVL